MINIVLNLILVMNIFAPTIIFGDRCDQTKLKVNNDFPQFSSSTKKNLRKRVDIVSYNASLLSQSEENMIRYTSLIEKFDVTFTYDLYKYVNNFDGDNQNLKKIIFFDYCEDSKTKKLPKKKMICFKWEAIKIHPHFYDYYYRVYTFDDDLVDNKKFFKFYYPVLQPLLEDTPPFNEKKLCVIIATNWISERISILDYFSTKPKDSLHIFGCAPTQYTTSEMNKGPIPGGVSSNEKLNTLKNYQFCICFENTHTTPGYITEKIFDVFAAGCVPIYWGPSNVEDYIPSDCFIDYRNFDSNEEMYQFITSMTQTEYDLYIDRIRDFLESEQAHLFSRENFERILYEAVCN